MKLLYKKSSAYRIAIAAVLSIATIACGIYLFTIYKPKPATQPTDLAPTNQQHQAGNDHLPEAPQKEQAPTDTPKKEGLSKPFEGNDRSQDAHALSGSITHLGKTDSHLRIRTAINQAISGGTCTLILTGPSTVRLTSGIIQNPSSSSCEGFDIPLSRLGSGTWSIRIELSSDSKTGLITGEVRL